MNLELVLKTWKFEYQISLLRSWNVWEKFTILKSITFISVCFDQYFSLSTSCQCWVAFRHLLCIHHCREKPWTCLQRNPSFWWRNFCNLNKPHNGFDISYIVDSWSRALSITCEGWKDGNEPQWLCLDWIQSCSLKLDRVRLKISEKSVNFTHFTRQ